MGEIYQNQSVLNQTSAVSLPDQCSISTRPVQYQYQTSAVSVPDQWSIMYL